jgi:hypothetical protein
MRHEGLAFHKHNLAQPIYKQISIASARQASKKTKKEDLGMPDEQRIGSGESKNTIKSRELWTKRGYNVRESPRGGFSNQSRRIG